MAYVYPPMPRLRSVHRNIFEGNITHVPAKVPVGYVNGRGEVNRVGGRGREGECLYSPNNVLQFSQGP